MGLGRGALEPQTHRLRPEGLSLNATFGEIRDYFEPAKAMSPTAVGNRTLPREPPRNPLRVMFRTVGACEQPVRSGAHGFRSHRLRSLLSLEKLRNWVSRPNCKILLWEVS
jgi:hypothetical protein